MAVVISEQFCKPKETKIIPSCVQAFHTFTIFKYPKINLTELLAKTTSSSAIHRTRHVDTGDTVDIYIHFLLLFPVLAEVCCDRLGCFSNNVPWAGTFQRPISRLPWAPERINTRFQLYTRDNLIHFQEITAINSSTILKSNFRKHQKTRFIIHGFINSAKNNWLVDMCWAILEVEDVNCICVDWSGGSRALYTQAANNVRVVGAEVAYFIDALKKVFDYLPFNVHIIGHSLGAHAAGEAGRRVPGIGRITGLDPAQPYFQGTPPEVRLDPSDAALVDAIHTDSTAFIFKFGYGMSQMVGHLDFFPNGGEKMPGCKMNGILKHVNLDEISQTFNDLAACNHVRSYMYYTESIRTPDGFIGFQSSSYDAFSKGEGFPCPDGGCPLMGHYADQYKGVKDDTQKFYLNTGDMTNFSRWRYKVAVSIVGSSFVWGSVAVSVQGSIGNIPDYTVYSGLIRSDTTYTAFIDAEANIGSISKVTFVWRCKIYNFMQHTLGASTVTVQFGKDGAM
ncbi:pancreatic triacylglycerol lipase-like [Dendropsophus ebraccatus]|uniref:pancreatic triacylglycerol lipase-like n=1 Tax=Dendropsophus ebraccatus TaxID=150705 RepID=UPI003831D07E